MEIIGSASFNFTAPLLANGNRSTPTSQAFNLITVALQRQLQRLQKELTSICLPTKRSFIRFHRYVSSAYYCIFVSDMKEGN